MKYYGRAWRLSKPQVDEPDSSLFGKLGFARRAQAEEVHYDEQTHDWIAEESPSRQGNFSHFVIDLKSQIVAFEQKGEDLSRQAFLNAMSRFLESGGFEITLLSDARSFDTWLAEVDRVTRFYASIRRPNPGWAGRAENVREVADETSADRLSIEATAEDSLTVRGTILDGAATTAARGNGHFTASGFVGQARRFFDSRRRWLGGIVEVSDADSSETILAKVRDAMRGLAPGDDDDDAHRE